MIEVRPLQSLAEFQDAVRLQKEIWGFEEIELLPVRLFVVASKIGGQSLGAFDGDRMVGFCIAIPGLKPGAQSYLHSHMLGVLPEYNNQGIGRMLKLEQRNDALERSLDLIEWTFDPLELKNAYFNIERLGAVVRRYVLNQYGTTTSFLHGSMPTDRCVAEWWIRSRWVQQMLSEERPRRPEIEARISVPVEIAVLRKENPGLAREIQKGVSDQFLRHFECGLAVVGFERCESEGAYLLGPWTSE